MLPQRKEIRLKEYDYNTSGYYFITICTKNKAKILWDIVGTGVLDGPKTKLSEYGEIADQQIKIMSDFYDYISVDKYVIMPNHIHLILHVHSGPSGRPKNGPSGRPVPTTPSTNSAVSKFVGTFKRFCNRKYGKNIWQSRSYDHIIRGEQDYKEIWEYIEENPAKWREDKFYIE